MFSSQTAGSLCWTYAAIFRDKQVNNLSNLLNRLDNHISSTLTLNTGVPQGCVLSPLLLALFTYACTPVHGSDTLLIFQCGELQRVVKTAQRITSASLPSIDAVQRKRFLQKECSHPNHWLFILYIEGRPCTPGGRIISRIILGPCFVVDKSSFATENKQLYAFITLTVFIHTSLNMISRNYFTTFYSILTETVKVYTYTLSTFLLLL